MPDIPAQLNEIADRVRAGKQSKHTLRSLLGYFGQARRGSVVNYRIAEVLAFLNLRTEPDFRSAYIDEQLIFVPADAPPRPEPPVGENAAAAEGNEALPADSEQVRAEVALASTAVRRDGSSYRVRRFVTEKKKELGIVRVALEATVAEAVTLMLYHDYSQLPVMANEKSLQGLVSWRTIGRAFALGSAPATVKECMEPPTEVSEHDPIFDLISLVQQHDAVFVRGEGRKYVTVFTAADLGDLYRDLSESFILLGEIEDHVRDLLDRARFTKAELNEARGPGDARTIERIDDLAFGTYIALIESEENWDRLGLRIDRSWFVRELDEIRELRNAVMHFDPDGLTDEQMAQLTRFCGLLRALRENAPAQDSA
jgi:CBS domain-containing protein